jgi:cbb3-type cytochrome oxidase maturation protein
MNQATLAQTIMTVLVLGIFLGLLVWGLKTRQFHDVEDPKYRMMHDEDEPAAKPQEGSHKP